MLAALIGAGSLGGCSGSSGSPATPPQQPASTTQSSAAQPAAANSILRSSASATATWPQFGYNSEHNGFNPLEMTLGQPNVSTLKLAWENPTTRLSLGIIAGADALYGNAAENLGNGPIVYAADPATGKVLWSTPVHQAINSPAIPAVFNNSIVLSQCLDPQSTFYGLCGYSAKTGAFLWRDHCVGQFCSGAGNPAIYNGLAYVVFRDTGPGNELINNAEAIAPVTGAVVWSVGIGACQGVGVTTQPPPAANGYVYYPMECSGSNGQLSGVCALAAQNGATVWCTNLSSIVFSVRASSGQVFVGAENNSSANLYALNARNGSVEWSVPLANLTNADVMAIADGRVVTAFNGIMLAYSTKTGKLLWEQTNHWGYEISIANHVIYTTGSGTDNHAINALGDKTGALLWSSVSKNDNAQASPIIVNGTVYAGCPKLCAFTLPAQLRTQPNVTTSI